MLENIVVLLVIAAAAVFVVRRFTRGGGCGCSGCGHESHGGPAACGDSCSPPPSGPDEEKDPVCGMRVGADAIVLEHHGRKYRFCSEHCRDNFARDPGRYV